MTATATTHGTCFKCDGTGRINAFSHIHRGACFACQGTGLVKLGARENAASNGKPSRTIALGTIMRDGDGFVLYMADGAAWFSVTGGRITDLIVSDAAAKRTREIAGGLQAALRT